MKSDTLNWLGKLCGFLLLASAIYFLAVYVIVALLRISYPFELEWLEGSILTYVIRILSGEKIYVKPSLNFVPYGYTPLYFYLSAAVAKVAGVRLLSLRLVSFSSSLLSFFLIFLLVQKETRSNYFGILAAGLFAATYKSSGAFFDIARVDSLALCLLLAAVYFIKFGDSIKSAVLAAILISLSFFTKQIALVIALALWPYLFSHNRRQAFYYALTAALLMGGGTWLLNYLHDGWYNFYTFTLLGDIPRFYNSFRVFLLDGIIAALPIACLVLLFYFYRLFSNTLKKEALFYLPLTGSILLVSAMARMKMGAWENTLIPACAIISIIFGLGTHQLLADLKRANSELKRFGKISVYLYCLGQFLLLVYNPLPQIPTKNDLLAGQKLLSIIKALPGDVFLQSQSYLAALAGKSSYVHGQALDDLISSYKIGSSEAAEIIFEIKSQMMARKFSAVIIDYNFYIYNTAKYYGPPQKIFADNNVFMPVTGARYRPNYIFFKDAANKTRTPLINSF